MFALIKSEFINVSCKVWDKICKAFLPLSLSLSLYGLV